LAVSLTRNGKQNIWVYNLERQTLTQLTFDTGPDFLAAWTPDGEFIAFRSGNTLAWICSDGSGKVERMSDAGRNAGPWRFSPDGAWLAFFRLEPRSDLLMAPVERIGRSLQLGQPQPLLQAVGSKGAPGISPDGRWLAYISDESGRFEVYVAPFSPDKSSGGKWQISNEGAVNPVWSRHAPELFFQGRDRRVHIAAYSVLGESFVAAKPRLWSEAILGDTNIFAGFDVHPDGKRVVALLPAEADPRGKTLARVLLNVDSELQRRASAHAR
jgi:serine/threonine-protein kinase